VFHKTIRSSGRPVDWLAAWSLYHLMEAFVYYPHVFVVVRLVSGIRTATSVVVRMCSVCYSLCKKVVSQVY
jgi:hypothetical protein